MESDHRNKRRQGMRDPGVLAKRTPDQSALERSAVGKVAHCSGAPSQPLLDAGRDGNWCQASRVSASSVLARDTPRLV